MSLRADEAGNFRDCEARICLDRMSIFVVVQPGVNADPPPLYANACRLTKREDEWMLEAWTNSLELGRPLPTVPLWLADNLAKPLESEESYEQSCNILNIA